MYLSPSQPAWRPRSEADLQQALTNDLLTETHYLDLKRELAPKARGNKELARDLAQFAIDGGQLLIGIAEGRDGASPQLYPLELNGAAERIEQIALSAIDPPLPVMCREIRSESNPTKGYLMVEVPISPSAPHMVDGQYIGRGDRMRVRLSDADVLRLHLLREADQFGAVDILDRYVARDPIPADLRQLAHLFVIAAPTRPRSDEMLLEHVGKEWEAFFNETVAAAYDDHRYKGGPRFDPSIRGTHRLHRRADGMARTMGLELDRTPSPGSMEVGTLELELGEDGTIRLLTCRLSDLVPAPHTYPPPSAAQVNLIFPAMIVDHPRHVITMARHIAERIGYLGSWHLGVAATGIAGLRIFNQSDSFVFPDRPSYPKDSDEYRSVTTATLQELRETPGALTRRLVGRLLRAFGTEDAYNDFLSDAPTDPA